MLTIDQIQLNQKTEKSAYAHYVDFVVPSCPVCLIGVDPGINFGVAYVHGKAGRVWWGKLPGTKPERGKRAIQAFDLVQRLCNNLDEGFRPVVEGAAYNKKFGQVGLEEVRIGFYMGLAEKFDPIIISPATIKAKVLGNGRAQAGDIWPWLNHNAADAISIALYAQYI